MSHTKTWSVIVCSIDAGKHAHIVQSYERLLAGRQFEIISIHDARSLAEAYNRGIAQARGDIIVFSHDDILILDDNFANKVETQLSDRFDLLGFAGATALKDGYWWSAGPEHMCGAVAHAPPAQPQISLHIYGITGAGAEPALALDGLCLIASRKTIELQGFDADAFDGFHLYDLDFCLSAHLQGLRIGVLTDVPIIHMSAGSFGNAWRHYRTRFAQKHATTLGLAADAPLDEPDKLRARVALFNDATSLRAFWTSENLCRATLAKRRQIV